MKFNEEQKSQRYSNYNNNNSNNTSTLSQINKSRVSSGSNLYNSMLNFYNKPNKRIPLVYINVFCRFRPPSELELEHTSNNCITILSPKQLLVRKDNNLDIQQDYSTIISH